MHQRCHLRLLQHLPLRVENVLLIALLQRADTAQRRDVSLVGRLHLPAQALHEPAIALLRAKSLRAGASVKVSEIAVSCGERACGSHPSLTGSGAGAHPGLTKIAKCAGSLPFGGLLATKFAHGGALSLLVTAAADVANLFP